MYPQLSDMKGPVFHVVTNSKLGKSWHRLAHKKGFKIPVPVTPTQYEISTIRDSSSRSLKSSMDMVCFEVDGNSAANGACKEGIPSAEERDEEQHNSRKNLKKRDIMFDSRMRMVRRWNSERGVAKPSREGCQEDRNLPRLTPETHVNYRTR